MSHAVQRVLLATAATGSILALAATPAGAASSAGMTSAPHGTSRAATAGGRPATVDAPQRGDVTGVASAAVGFQLTGATCFSNDVAFTARTYETGFSGVQRFRQKAQLQEFTNVGWVNRSGVSTSTSTWFPNDSRSFSYTRDWDGRHVVDGASWRVVWQGVYLNGSGQAIAKTRPVAVTCA